MIAVTTNIEGREHLGHEQVNSGSSLEHPRAASTDDVERFFSMMRDTIGQDVTINELKFGVWKILSQFSKRIDPDLPFYYFTTAYSRYYEGTHPDFDKPRQNSIRHQESPGENYQLVLGRGVLPYLSEEHLL